MPQIPTLILTSHVPIVMHMGMMTIIAPHFTQNYNKVNQRPPMLVKAKVSRKAKKGKVWPTKGWPPSQLKVNPTPWRLGLHSWKP
jgi:hypothetical protein